jgi:predicted aminopeptidase
MVEMSREKSGDCKDASSTHDAVICLGKQGQITTENYEAMTRSLRALLALSDADAVTATAGPTGKALTPAQQAAEFDGLQQNWDVYRKTVQSAAYDQFEGGTEAPISNALADQMVMRSHMKELASIYDFILGNH